LISKAVFPPPRALPGGPAEGSAYRQVASVNHFNPDRYSYRLQLRRVDPAGSGPGSR
jgi:hypothetical protein